MPKLTTFQRFALWVALVLVMAGTRGYHLGNALHLPDATPALFFVGGLLFALRWGWAVLLLAAAACIDFLAIRYGGVSAFCVSPAYGFLLPAYLLMWLAGHLAARRGTDLATKLAGGAGLLAVASLASFLLSTASFHFLSGRIAAPDFLSLLEVTSDYLPAWLGSSFAYVGGALLVMRAVQLLNRRRGQAVQAS